MRLGEENYGVRRVKAKNVLFVIEHLEPRLSKWMLLEYRHASEIVGRDNLVITNAGGFKEKLKNLGIVFNESIADILGSKITYRKAIVLDPKAEKLLEPNDIVDDTVIIVGGIMGDHPPKGRTWTLLTAKLLGKAVPRSLGPYQFSIDGAVYMAYQVVLGRRISEIEIVYDIEVEVPSPIRGVTHSIRLPYAYPVVNGKPLLAPGLLDYLKYHIQLEEEELLNK